MGCTARIPSLLSGSLDGLRGAHPFLAIPHTGRPFALEGVEC